MKIVYGEFYLIAGANLILGNYEWAWDEATYTIYDPKYRFDCHPYYRSIFINYEDNLWSL